MQVGTIGIARRTGKTGMTVFAEPDELERVFAWNRM